MILAENFDAVLKSRAGILPGERLGRRFFLFPADLSLRSPFANSAKEQTDSNMASESVCFYRAAVRAGLDRLQAYFSAMHAGGRCSGEDAAAGGM